jgi:GT2 family glycosyltransferase
MLDIVVIIPFKDKAKMTLECLKSLIKFGQPVREIVLVSNNSSPSELKIIKKQCALYDNVRVLVYNFPFNFQKINNWAVRYTQSKVIFFLNNDTVLTRDSRSILSTMYQRAIDQDSGAVGCVLVYGDKRTIQHAGVYLVPGGTADHLYIGQSLRKVKRNIAKKNYKYDITQDLRVSAVTAAAMMVEREKYNQISGFNENFIVGGGDVDLCLRLEAIGLKNWMIGSRSGYIIHKESKSRSSLTIPYTDFIESYKSYILHFDLNGGDKYVRLQGQTDE